MVSYTNVIFTGVRIIVDIAVGFVLMKTKVVRATDSAVINKYLFKFSYIPLLMKFLMSKKITQLNFSPLLTFFLTGMTTEFAYSLIFAFPLKDKFGTFLSMMFPTLFVNYIIIGTPFFNGLWDSSENVIVCIINFSNDLIFVPLYILESTIYKIREANVKHKAANEPLESFSYKSLLEILKRIFTSPIVIGNIIGIIYSATGLAIPTILNRFATLLGDTVLALSLFNVGCFLSQHSIIACSWPKFIIAILMRHIFMPLMISIYCYALHFTAKVARQCIVLSCVATATSSFLMAEANGIGPEVASTMVFWTTIFCVPSIIFWLFILDKLEIFVE